MTASPIRIPPVEPPYEPAIEAALTAMMPRGSLAPPLRLFRTLARHPQLAEAMHGLGRFLLGRELALDLRTRELVIHRVCGRCRCEYEWGVHAAFFAGRAGLDDAQLASTAHGSADDPCWSAADAAVIRLVDELHDAGGVNDATWAALAARFDERQLLELLLLAGWYHAIAYLANGAGVEREEWARRF